MNDFNILFFNYLKNICKDIDKNKYYKNEKTIIKNQAIKYMRSIKLYNSLLIRTNQDNKIVKENIKSTLDNLLNEDTYYNTLPKIKGVNKSNLEKRTKSLLQNKLKESKYYNFLNINSFNKIIYKKDLEYLKSIINLYKEKEEYLTEKAKDIIINEFESINNYWKDNKKTPLKNYDYEFLLDLEKLLNNINHKGRGKGLSEEEMIKMLNALPDVPNSKSKDKIKIKN